MSTEEEEEEDITTHDFRSFKSMEFMEKYLFARLSKGEEVLLNRNHPERQMEIRTMGEGGEWEGPSMWVPLYFYCKFSLEFRYLYQVYLKDLKSDTDYGFIGFDGGYHAFISRSRTEVLRRRKVKPAKVERRGKEEEKSLLL